MEELKAIPLVQVLLAFCEGTAEPYQWGILAGCCVYAATVLVVFYLLAAGGSFRRMREQVRASAGKAGNAPTHSQPAVRVVHPTARSTTTPPHRPRRTSGRGPRRSRCR